MRASVRGWRCYVYAADMEAAGSKFNPILVGNWRPVRKQYRRGGGLYDGQENFFDGGLVGRRRFDATTNMRINNSDVVVMQPYWQTDGRTSGRLFAGRNYSNISSATDCTNKGRRLCALSVWSFSSTSHREPVTEQWLISDDEWLKRSTALTLLLLY